MVLLVAAVAVSVAPVARAAGLAGLIAPTSACPGQSRAGAAAAVQLKAMRCLTNYARGARGLAPLGDARALDRAAAHKSADVLACDEFSHEACGREFTYWMQRFGYVPQEGCWSAGENIAWGTGGYATPRAIFSGWVHSPGHLRNLLSPYRQLGIGLRIGTLEGHGGAHVWTQDFGSREC